MDAFSLFFALSPAFGECKSPSPALVPAFGECKPAREKGARLAVLMEQIGHFCFGVGGAR